MGKLIAIRHGQSTWNAENRFTGWVDVDLSEKGVAEAEKSGNLIKELNIDFESFVILQVVVSHSLYETNKLGTKSFSDLEEQMEKITEKNYLNKRKLTFASIAEVLQLPRETVRRKIISLSKKDILSFNSYSGIKLGPSYKTIYKDFVMQTTLDLSSLVNKWDKSGALKNLLELAK